MRVSTTRRGGGTTAECAIIFPAPFLLLMGLIIGAAGVFRYQAMPPLARPAAPHAPAHGTQWAKDTGTPAPTPADIYTAVIAPNTFGLDKTRLTYSITYDRSNAPYHTDIVNGDIV